MKTVKMNVSTLRVTPNQEQTERPRLVVTKFPNPSQGDPRQINGYLDNIRQIVRHPDRDNLLAQLFADF